jgi:tetratricopeptide (TPR) repeat protein
VQLLQGDLVYQRFGMSGLPSVLSRAHLARALAELGEFDEAATRAEEAVRAAHSVGHPYDLIVAYIAANDVWLRRGHADRAIPTVERALALCRSSHLPVWFPTIATNLGLGYALAGRIDEALPLLEQAVEQADAMRIMYNQALRLAFLGEGYLAASRLDDAAAVGQRAFNVAHQQDERGHEVWALRLLGEAAARQEPPAVEVATTHFSRALSLAEELGMRPLAARCRLGLGALHRRCAQWAAARSELAEAAKLFRAMDMGSWLAQAESGLEGGPPAG